MVYIRGLFTSTLEKRKTECKYLVHNIMYNMKQIQQLLVHFTRSNNTQEGAHIRLHGENKIDLMHKKLFQFFGKQKLFLLLAGAFAFTQYRSFSGVDSLQNLGGGHPRALKRGKFTNAELHNFKFPLFCGDLICLDFVTSLLHSTKDRIHIKRSKPRIVLIFIV